MVDRESLTTAYDLVSALHPNVPSYTLWMAWELAGMRRHQIRGEVLDLGCQDPRLAALVLDGAQRICGLASDPLIAETARQQGGYADLADATQVDQGTWRERFDTVYSRGSISVSDDLQGTLARARRVLRPGGTLVCSVLTEHYASMSGLAATFSAVGQTGFASRMFQDYLEFHHVRHAMCQSDWERNFALAGLRVTEITPILPVFSFRVFSMIDELWHATGQDGQPLGIPIAARLAALPGFRNGFRSIVDGLAEIDTQQSEHAALVLKAVVV
jgi:SAM-dependent methyltransferase